MSVLNHFVQSFGSECVVSSRLRTCRFVRRDAVGGFALDWPLMSQFAITRGRTSCLIGARFQILAE